MKNIALVNLTELEWDEAMELLEQHLSDGWEVLAIKALPDGVWALVQERIVKWLDRKPSKAAPSWVERTGLAGPTDFRNPARSSRKRGRKG